MELLPLLPGPIQNPNAIIKFRVKLVKLQTTGKAN
jgi:hypothetical protein